MNGYGWIFMLVSTISVTSLTLWCFARVLSEPRERKDDQSR
jgi:hypothetical protein